jgi:hypothetical protein
MPERLFLEIALMLEGNFLFLLYFLEKLSQDRPIQGLPFLRMLALVFALLLGNEIPLFFGSSVHLCVVISNTFQPLPIYVGVDDPHIVWLEANRDR